MIVLLTGGTGLVGRRLGQILVKDGHEVRILTRESQAQVPYPAQQFVWQGERELPPPEALQNVNAVIHLAGEGIADQRWDEERKKRLVDSRVKTTMNLEKGLKLAEITPQVYIGASAIGYYGDCEDEVLSEASAKGPGFLADLCAQWEAAHLKVPAERHVILRFGVVLSERGGFLQRVQPIFQSLGASRLGSGKQWFSWIHLEDLVFLIGNALSNTRISGVLNAVAPEPVTNAVLTQEVAAALKTFSAPTVPSIALKILYGEMTEALIGSQRVHGGLSNVGFHFRYPTFKRALEKIYGSLGAGESRVIFEQWIPRARQEVFQFFSNEHNLEEITPEFLNFKVLGKNTPSIEQGTQIDYQLKIHGVPTKWCSLIEEWRPQESFVDIQTKGPYSRWHHHHEFEDLGKGTLMRDTITYKMPLGRWGKLAAGPFVEKDVSKIFSFRSNSIRQIFAR